MDNAASASLSRRIVLMGCLAATTANIAPMLLLNLGGDLLFHRVVMECFATQFWQGDLYPRWCMDINSGEGAPIFMFYFPLPYFFAALMWPAVWLGATSYHIYAAGCATVTLLTFLTCYSWLKDVVEDRYALMCSALFLFMPYRMEAFWFRSDYAELWGIAFLPMALKYTRRTAHGEMHSLPLLALSFALLLLSHVPTAAVAALMCGLYTLVTAWNRWRALICFSAGVGWGLAAAAFYLLPAVYYKRYINPHPIANPPWADTYLRVFAMITGHQYLLAIVMTMNAAASGLLVLWLLYRARSLDSPLRKEMAAWGLIFALALYLFFPVSMPFYSAMPWLRQVILPWRMQNVFAPCVAFMLALWMQRMASPQQRKFQKSNFVGLLCALALVDSMLAGMRPPEFKKAELGELTKHHVVFADQYQTRWTPDDHYTDGFMDKRAFHPAPKVKMQGGSGNVEVTHWGWDGIGLASHAQGFVSVLLDHIYFPIWQARSEQGEPLHLYPDAASGQMMLDIPAGVHRVYVRRDMAAANPALYFSSSGISIAAAALWMACIMRRRRFYG